MKIFVFFICIIFSILYFASGICLAAPVGNPAGPVLLEGHYPTKFTIEAESVFERKLKTHQSGNPKFSGMFYTGKVSLYTGRKLDLYFLAGTYQGKIKNYINEQYMIESKMDAAFGAGISYVLYDLEFLGGILRLGADAKYRVFQPDIDKVKRTREKIVTTTNTMKCQEWQGSLGVAYQYKKFVPYVGMKYSDVDIDIKFEEDAISRSENSISSKDTWGIFYGIDILAADNISLNIEARTRDEKALTAGLNVRF